jgi:hypothetical protein
VIAGSAGAATVGAGVVAVGAFATSAGGLGLDVGVCDVCSEASAAAGTVGVAVTSPAT